MKRKEDNMAVQRGKKKLGFRSKDFRRRKRRWFSFTYLSIYRWM